MRNVIAIIGAIVVAALMVIALIPYADINQTEYENTLDGDQITAVMDTMRVIEVRGKVYRSEREEDWNSNAIAVAISENLIIAETHATKISNYMHAYTPFGRISLPQKVLEERFYINDIEIDLIGRYRDISLFWTPFTMSYIPFGDSDLLELGTTVISVGWSLGKGINIKNGIVSMMIRDEQYDPPEAPPEESFKDIVFMITAPINPGDSGSPVLAIKNGKYVIVGLACARIKDHGLGFAYLSNFVKEAINTIMMEMETSNVN